MRYEKGFGTCLQKWSSGAKNLFLIKELLLGFIMVDALGKIHISPFLETKNASLTLFEHNIMEIEYKFYKPH